MPIREFGDICRPCASARHVAQHATPTPDPRDNYDPATPRQANVKQPIAEDHVEHGAGIASAQEAAPLQGVERHAVAEVAAVAEAEIENRWLWQDSSDSQRAHAILAAVLLLGAQPWSQQFKAGSIFYFTALAVCTIYIGTHKGLTTDLRQHLSVKEVRPAKQSGTSIIVCLDGALPAPP